MPLRVIQHYSDWVCTAVISNDVMKDLRGYIYICIYKLNLQTVLFRPLRSHQCSSEWFENWDMSVAQRAFLNAKTHLTLTSSGTYYF